MYGYVYKTTNLVNAKVYIGRHVKSFNPKYLGSGLLIKKAINKYGVHQFKVEFLVAAKTEDELNVLEKKVIAAYRKLIGTKLYNIADGGQTGSGIVTHKVTCGCFPCRAHRGELLGAANPMFGKSSARKGVPAWNRGRDAWNKGKVYTHVPDCVCPFCKRKQGLSNGENHPMFGKEQTEKQKARAREVHTGSTKSAATRKRMSLAAKLLWNNRKCLYK